MRSPTYRQSGRGCSVIHEAVHLRMAVTRVGWESDNPVLRGRGAPETQNLVWLTGLLSKRARGTKLMESTYVLVHNSPVPRGTDGRAGG
jgi:hypothetical protein